MCISSLVSFAVRTLQKRAYISCIHPDVQLSAYLVIFYAQYLFTSFFTELDGEPISNQTPTLSQVFQILLTSNVPKHSLSIPGLTTHVNPTRSKHGSQQSNRLHVRKSHRPAPKQTLHPHARQRRQIHRPLLPAAEVLHSRRHRRRRPLMYVALYPNRPQSRFLHPHSRIANPHSRHVLDARQPDRRSRHPGVSFRGRTHVVQEYTIRVFTSSAACANVHQTRPLCPRRRARTCSSSTLCPAASRPCTAPCPSTTVSASSGS
jgi:hypothetical protein